MLNIVPLAGVVSEVDAAIHQLALNKAAAVLEREDRARATGG